MPNSPEPSSHRFPSSRSRRQAKYVSVPAQPENAEQEFGGNHQSRKNKNLHSPDTPGEDAARGYHLGQGHEANLPAVLDLGRRLGGASLPDDISVIAIEARELTTFSEHLTPEVASAIPQALDILEKLLVPV